MTVELVAFIVVGAWAAIVLFRLVFPLGRKLERPGPHNNWKRTPDGTKRGSFYDDTGKSGYGGADGDGGGSD